VRTYPAPPTSVIRTTHPEIPKRDLRDFLQRAGQDGRVQTDQDQLRDDDRPNTIV